MKNRLISHSSLDMFFFFFSPVCLLLCLFCLLWSVCVCTLKSKFVNKSGKYCLLSCTWLGLVFDFSRDQIDFKYRKCHQVAKIKKKKKNTVYVSATKMYEKLWYRYIIFSKEELLSTGPVFWNSLLNCVFDLVVSMSVILKQFRCKIK